MGEKGAWEALLWQKLEKINKKELIISRKIGKIIIRFSLG